MEYLSPEGYQSNFSESGAFLLSGRGHPQDDTTPSFFMNSKSPILGLSNDISFVSFFPWIGGQNSKIVKSSSLPSRLF